jgi:hypothetical protein
MFAVESVDDTVARLRANGAELVDEVAEYKDMYRLCYVRGPAGIIVALAEEFTVTLTNKVYFTLSSANVSPASP